MIIIQLLIKSWHDVPDQVDDVWRSGAKRCPRGKQCLLKHQSTDWIRRPLSHPDPPSISGHSSCNWVDSFMMNNWSSTTSACNVSGCQQARCSGNQQCQDGCRTQVWSTRDSLENKEKYLQVWEENVDNVWIRAGEAVQVRWDLLTYLRKISPSKMFRQEASAYKRNNLWTHKRLFPFLM